MAFGVERYVCKNGEKYINEDNEFIIVVWTGPHSAEFTYGVVKATRVIIIDILFILLGLELLWLKCVVCVVWCTILSVIVLDAVGGQRGGMNAVTHLITARGSVRRVILLLLVLLMLLCIELQNRNRIFKEIK